jgi:hypothetical protein
MKNGDIAELPPVEQLLGRQRHAAPGDGRSVRPAGHRVRRHRVPGRAGAQVQLRLRGLPRHRPRELPEGGLLEGRAARGPRPGAAEERLAVRGADPAPRLAGARFVLQGGTQYNLAAVKAQVDYIKERVPGAEVFVHPHTGEAGAIGAAFETLRVVKRRGSSTFIGLDAAIDLEYTTKNDEETVCHFCPNECKRTFIDTKTPDGRTSRYISGFSCEKGTVESEGGDAGARRRAQEDRQAVPEPRRLRGRSWRSAASTSPRRCRPRARPCATSR